MIINWWNGVGRTCGRQFKFSATSWFCLLAKIVTSLSLSIGGFYVLPPSCVQGVVCLGSMAMEDIVGRWKSLSITEEEGEIVGIDDETLQEGEKEVQSGILGKVLTKRPIRKTSFRGAIARLWKVEGGFTMRELENDVFLFLFNDEKERRRILDMEPWVFDKHLIVLKEVNGDDVPNWGDWCYTPFWVQAHNLPMRCIGEKIGMMIGEATGVALRVWKDKEGKCSGSFLRIRVLVDVSKPIRRVVPVRLGSSGVVHWAELKFERIPDFCFVCGRIGHIVSECQDPAAEAMIEAKKFQYGDWLIASRSSNPGGGGLAGVQKDFREKRSSRGDGNHANSERNIPVSLPGSSNQGVDSQVAKSREFRPNHGNMGCVTEVSAGAVMEKELSPNVETAKSSYVEELVINSDDKVINEAREKHGRAKELMENPREQDHAEQKGPGGLKRKLEGELSTGDRKRMELGGISNTGISAEVAEQPRREI